MKLPSDWDLGDEIIVNDGDHYNTAVVTYQHVYRGTFSLDPATPRTHTCFEYGHWCWQQLRTHPIQSVHQIIVRLKKRGIR